MKTIPRTLPRTFESLETLDNYEATTKNCPSCGQRLIEPEMAQHDPDLPPYLCTAERRWFWPVELHPAARRRYVAYNRDWGSTSQWLRMAVERNRRRA
jgi:hypothetical protein